MRFYEEAGGTGGWGGGRRVVYPITTFSQNDQTFGPPLPPWLHLLDFANPLSCER